MYMLCTRCHNNISVINHQLEKHKDNKIIESLFNTVKDLYNKVMKSWKLYSDKLTNKESEVGSMIADRFTKIFKSESFREKDKFMVGV